MNNNDSLILERLNGTVLGGASRSPTEEGFR
jgi:hypothetical protein